jgi:hypothetical protein
MFRPLARAPKFLFRGFDHWLRSRGAGLNSPCSVYIITEALIEKIILILELATRHLRDNWHALQHDYRMFAFSDVESRAKTLLSLPRLRAQGKYAGHKAPVEITCRQKGGADQECTARDVRATAAPSSHGLGLDGSTTEDMSTMSARLTWVAAAWLAGGSAARAQNAASK